MIGMGLIRPELQLKGIFPQKKKLKGIQKVRGSIKA